MRFWRSSYNVNLNLCKIHSANLSGVPIGKDTTLCLQNFISCPKGQLFCSVRKSPSILEKLINSTTFVSLVVPLVGNCTTNKCGIYECWCFDRSTAWDTSFLDSTPASSPSVDRGLRAKNRDLIIIFYDLFFIVRLT